MIAAVLVALVGLFAGGCLGMLFGFSVASHKDVLQGVRPIKKNRLILFLARPTHEMRFPEAMIFLLLMLIWLAAFLGLAAAPAIASTRLSDDGPPLILLAYGCTAIAWWVGQKFGAHAWSAMS